SSPTRSRRRPERAACGSRQQGEPPDLLARARPHANEVDARGRLAALGVARVPRHVEPAADATPSLSLRRNRPCASTTSTVTLIARGRPIAIDIAPVMGDGAGRPTVSAPGAGRSPTPAELMGTNAVAAPSLPC